VVRHCPKLSTRFATTSNDLMSAQSEVLYIWHDFLPLLKCFYFLFPSLIRLTS
jgi:hypothetical protein